MEPGALPNTITNLVIGASALNTPFKGGVLGPSLDALVTGLPVDALGGHLVSSTWPSGLPPGLVVWLQHWIVDPAGPAGLSASNGLAVGAL